MSVPSLPRTHTARCAPVLCLLALCAGARPAGAQLRASERGSVSQTVDGTTITIEYSRPVARGRDSLFGGVVRFGEMWTPGANWATTLETDRDIRIAGQPLRKGKYSVWMIPQAPPAEWTVMFSRDAQRFHTNPPPVGDAEARFTTKPEQGVHMETLTWYFPVIARDAATLRMHWGTTIVPMLVSVQPSAPDTLAAAQRARYLGSYVMRWTAGGASDSARVVVTERDGRLRARSTPGMPEVDPELELIPAGRDRFLYGFYRNGQLYDVETSASVIFLLDGARASGFEVRGAANEVIGHAQRIP